MESVTHGPAFQSLCHLSRQLQAVEMHHLWLRIFVQFLFMKTLLFGAETRNSTEKHGIAMRLASAFQPRGNYTRTEISINATEVQERTLTPGSTWINEVGCGKIYSSSSDHSPRVVGGSNAVRGEWPWIAMILRYYKTYNNNNSNNKFSFVCGGSLIQKQWVLTAGHCLFNDPSSYTHVVLGAHRKDMKDESVKRFAIAKYICHYLFIGPSNAFEDDICLIKLAGEVQYTNYIKPICLPVSDQSIVNGKSCKIAGWGETQGTGDNSILQNARVNIIEKSSCDLWYKDVGVTLPEKHFCAGFEGGLIDSCQGDSGGPLTCIIQKKNTLCGITSFGIGCAVKHRPGVYTEVPQYMNWVQTQISKHSGKESCFSASDLLSCGSTITQSGTRLRTPVTDTQTWMYPPNKDCSWNIIAPENCYIKLIFECFFHVEINPSNTAECFDYMKIVSEELDMVSIFCGSVLLNPVMINSTRATVSFRSDSSLESSGFVLKVIFINNPKSRTPETTKASVNPRLVVGEPSHIPCEDHTSRGELATSTPCPGPVDGQITNSDVQTPTPSLGDQHVTHSEMIETTTPCEEEYSTTSAGHFMKIQSIWRLFGFSLLLLKTM